MWKLALRGIGAAESEAAMERTLKIGQYVKVVDEVGQTHDGLVTNQWGCASVKDGEPGPCINVLYVVDDPARTDPYGNQIERLSSTSHKRSTAAPGRYWYFPDEAF
jgi:hypothetical protein